MLYVASHSVSQTHINKGNIVCLSHAHLDLLVVSFAGLYSFRRVYQRPSRKLVQIDKIKWFLGEGCFKYMIIIVFETSIPIFFNQTSIVIESHIIFSYKCLTSSSKKNYF